MGKKESGRTKRGPVRGEQGAAFPRPVPSARTSARAHTSARTGTSARTHTGANTHTGTASRPAPPTADPLRMTLMLGFLALIFFPPYFRGLYFPGEQLVALMAALLLFALAWVDKFHRNDYVLLESPSEYLSLALVGAYALSLTVAASTRGAIQDVAKYLLYFIVLWLAARLTTEGLPHRRRDAGDDGPATTAGPWALPAALPGAGPILAGLLAGTAGTALLGVAAAAGTLDYAGAVVAERISSTLQYPNTLAAFLTAGFFLNLAFWPLARRRWTLVHAVSGYLLFFVFLLARSRGGALLFPVILAIFLALQPRGYRLTALVRAAAAMVAATAAALPFGQAMVAGNGGSMWLYFLAGLPLAAGLGLAADRVATVGARTRRAVVLATVALVIGGAAMAGWRGLLTGNLLGRFLEIGLDYNAWSRLRWTLDALRVVADRPFLGTGGGGWAALYQQYQSYGYYTKQVHNHFAQVLVETGAVGFLAFLGVWVAFALAAHRALRKAGPVSRILLAGPVAAALALGVHSLIDFNLALSATAVSLWACFGVMAGAERRLAPRGGTPRGRRIRAADYRLAPRAVLYLVVAVLFLGTWSLYVGFNAGQKAAALWQDRKAAEARHAFEQAIKYDPFTASHFMDLGRMYDNFGRSGDDGEGVARPGEAEGLMKRALQLEPYNADLQFLYASALFRQGRLEEGLTHLERVKELQPYVAGRYDEIAEINFALGEIYWKQGRKEDAKARLAEVQAMARRLGEMRDREPARVPGSMRLPATTPRLEFLLGKSQAILGNDDEALKHLEAAAAEEQFRAEARLWSGLIHQRGGREEEGFRLIEEALGESPQLKEALRELRQLLKV